LKASNVLVETNGSLKLAGFGYGILLHILLEKMTPASANDGKYLWLAPEIHQNEGIDSRADIWGIGALTYELFLGKPPFFEETKGHLQSIKSLMKRRGRLPMTAVPVTMAEEITALGQSFIRTCMAYEPSQRTTIHELRRHPFLRRPGVTSDREEDERVHGRRQDQPDVLRGEAGAG
jgi:serine/threonine protein kinase